MILTVVYIL